MLDFIRRSMGGIRTLVGNMTLSQKVAISSALVALLMALTWGLSAASGDSWVRLVGAEVPRDERAEIQKKLVEKNHRHKVVGDEIRVPFEDADRLTLELAGDGILSEKAIWDILERSDITATRWDKEMRERVALQRALQRMINKIKAVKESSVVIVPESETRSLGFAGGARATATVQVELRSGHKLERQNVIAVTHLVARAVRGLAPDQVILTDTAGKAYKIPPQDTGAELAATMADAAEHYEKLFKSKLLDLFPEARISVGVQLKPGTKSTESEMVTKPVAVEEHDRSLKDKSGSSGGAAGIKQEGSYSLAPESVGLRKDVDEKESTSKSVPSVTRTKEHDPAGYVEKVTVAVYLPVEVDDANAQKQMEEAQAMIPRMKKMVAAAVGPKASEESVEIMAMPTRRPAPLPLPGFLENAGAFLGRYWITLFLGLLGVAALLFIYVIMSRALPAGVIDEMEVIRRRVGEEVAVSTMPEIALADEELGRMRLGIRDMVHRNPRGIANIVKRWLVGK